MLNKYDLIPGIDIHEALASHVDLGNRLRDLIEGDREIRLDAAEVSSEVHCVLGKWIHGRATLRYARLPEFAALRDAHAEFHVCAGNALKVLQDGNTAAARALQNGALRNAVDSFKGSMAGFCTAAAHFTNAGRAALAAAGGKISRAIVARRAFWILASAFGVATALRVLGTESTAAARALPFGMPDLLAMLAVAGPGLYFLIVRPLLTAREHLSQAEVDLQIANAAIETLPPMLITDSNSMIVKVNRAFCEVTGYSAEEVIGKSPKLLRSHKHDAAFFAEMWGTIARAGTWHGATWNRRKDGGEFLADLSIDALRGEAGEPIAYVSRFTDLTEQRVGMLATEAPEVPEGSPNTRTEFLTYMGHQLRTPMNAMLGYTDLALNEAPQGAMRGYLEQVRDAGQKLLGRIDDVLDLSRIEAGNLALERVEFDLRAVCTAAYRTAVVVGSAKGIALESSIDNGIPGKVLGDPTRTAQILDILLGNAVRYSDQGKVSFAVTLHRLGSDMANIGIMVRDTGIGMDAAQVSRLFAPFAGAERPVIRHEGGPGLGLVVAKSLVEQMGARWRLRACPARAAASTRC